jgi:hypothetical protein
LDQTLQELEAQFAAYVQAEIVRNAAIAKAAGLKPQ